MKDENLPEMDTVGISHDHYDHLEMSTIKDLAPRTKLLIVKLGVSSHQGIRSCSRQV
ncbi:hypothetical protein [Maridesulfovibrio sp.]|uniref:hypothetical protein n=1 Tax=Maridesulfovibrio sp. TaxID=2795000 RepID=UPI002AA94F03|nr:hypothetical protein [Maridesulfovibrio sp.]